MQRPKSLSPLLDSLYPRFTAAQAIRVGDLVPDRQLEAHVPREFWAAAPERSQMHNLFRRIAGMERR